MRKFLIIILTLLLLLCSCRKEETPATVPTGEPEAETEVIIQDVTGPEAEVDPEDITEPVETETVIRLTRTTVLNDRGEEILYLEYVYDSYGRQTESWEYSDGEVTSFSTTTWISNTQSETVSRYGDSEYPVLSDYDEQGNLIRVEYPDEGRITEYTYDEFGNTLTVQNGDGSGFRYVYTYGENGTVLVREEYLGEDLVGRLEMEYDEAGKEISSIYYYPDGSVNYRTETIREGSTETRTSFDSEGNAYLTQITVTDELGNILSRETWQGDEMVSRTEYTYEEIEIIVQ